MTKRKTNRLFGILLLIAAAAVIFSTIQIPVSAIQLSFSPPNGPIGTVVTVTSGTGYTIGDACTITSSTIGLIAPGYTCTISAGPAPPAGTVSGSFTVGPGVAQGTYSITVADHNAHSASASFTVLQPTITLTPQSGPVNTVVSVKSGGVKFSVGEPGCTITSLTLALGPTSCTVSSGVVTGQFQVAANPPGPYRIDVTGTSSGAVASATYTVTATITVISLTPTDGPFRTKITVQGSGFSTSDTSCQITALPDTTTVAASPAPSCSVGGSGKVTGTFYVGLAEAVNTAETITVTASPGGDSASVSFTIDGSPQLAFTPPSPQPAGTTVVVSLSAGQFSSGDVTGNGVTCTISASGGLFQSSACSITSGGAALTGTFFVVSNAPSGNTYTVTVKGTLGDSASATFTIAPPPVVAAIFLSPSDGPVGTKITVTGTNFPSLDSSCILSASATLFAASPAPTCTISAGKPSASFTVASGVVPGFYTVTVTSSSGATASETFIVDATPTLAFTPPSPQGPGVTVQVSIASGSFSTGDSVSCTISNTPGGLFQSSACHLAQGPPQSLAGTFFVIANVPSGSTYTVTVRGSLGDTAVGTFTVVSPVGPQLIAVPEDGPRGTRITLQGTSFSGRDTTCVITSTPVNIIASPATCTVSTGGLVTTSFTVSSAADPTLNPYTITVTGSSGDLGSAAFRVDPTPTLTFTPAGPSTPGTTVMVAIAISIPQGQFSSGDTSCTISSSPGGLFFSSNCHIGSAGTDLTGTFFQVAPVPSASVYTVTVTGNLGDTAVGIFQVTVATLLTLTPSYGSPGVQIAFVARGLIVTDTSCSVTSNTGVNGAILITASTCSIAGGTGTGTFVVGSTATADSTWTVTVTGNPGGDTVSTGFTVVPTLSVSPANGVGSSVVSLTGAGFGSAATSCTVSSAPGGAMPNPFFFNPGCNLIVPGPNGNGHVSGTFTVNPGALAGTYVITVTDNTLFAASTTFTVGSPNANVTLTPNTVTPPQSGSVAVGISGFGFNGGDNACTVTVTPPIFGFCTISGGTAGGTVTVPAGTPAGEYLVTITGNTGDFASNYLGVNAITTATTTTSTTSTSTTATTTTTLTSSTSISSSLTTTTFTSTGATTQVFTQGTMTTVSAVTTVTAVTVAYTSSPTTQTTTTTTTATFGQIIHPSLSDELGLVATLLLVVPFLFRRLLR